MDGVPVVIYMYIYIYVGCGWRVITGATFPTWITSRWWGDRAMERCTFPTAGRGCLSAKARARRVGDLVFSADDDGGVSTGREGRRGTEALQGRGRAAGGQVVQSEVR